MIVLGVDIGTTGCKTIAFDETGRVVGTGYQSYPLSTDAGGKVEQDPDDWIRGMITSIQQATKDIDKSVIGGMALSTQAASSLLVDEACQPLTPAITWMDLRATAQKELIERELGNEYVYHTTGWKTHAELDMAKSRWLSENEKELSSQAYMFISTLEYANHYLTGFTAIDPTNAAMRQLMDIRTKKWDPQLLDYACIRKEQLPSIVESGCFLGFLTSSAANECGLGTNVKVFNGAHDQYCGALGASILKPGELMLSTGTAWVTLAVSEKIVYSTSFISPGPHIIPGLYGALVSLPTAGAALDWLKKNITGSTYEEIDNITPKRIGKCKDLYFYPYLVGSNFPSWEDRARGTFVGLDMDSDRFDMALACMEGVAFQLRRTIDEYEKSGVGITDVHVMGGALNSSIWLLIISSVCSKRIHIMKEKDTPCIGAACLAGVGTGLFENYEQAARLMNKSTLYDAEHEWRKYHSESTQTELTDHYQRKYQNYANKWELINKVYEAD